MTRFLCVLWDDPMYKFMIIFRQSEDVDQFEGQYNEFLSRVEKMPGVVRRQVADVIGSPTGQSPYYRILEVYYNNRREMELSLATPIGQDAGRRLQLFPPGTVEMVFANVYEEAGGWPPERTGEM